MQTIGQETEHQERSAPRPAPEAPATPEPKAAPAAEGNGADASPPAASPFPDKLTVMLRKPITTHEGEVDSLTFREPTGVDIERIGNPVRVFAEDGEWKSVVDEKKMTAMLALLANVTPREINSLSGKDRIGCSWAVERFFYPDFAKISF